MALSDTISEMTAGRSAVSLGFEEHYSSVGSVPVGVSSGSFSGLDG